METHDTLTLLRGARGDVEVPYLEGRKEKEQEWKEGLQIRVYTVRGLSVSCCRRSFVVVVSVPSDKSLTFYFVWLGFLHYSDRVETPKTRRHLSLST